MGVVDVGGAAAAEQGHDDGEADHDLGRGDHHREERQDLAVEVADLARERHQGQVHRVQLQLDRHEDDERIAADQHAERSDGEQHAGQDQEIGDRRSHATGSGMSSWGGACPRLRWRPGTSPGPLGRGSCCLVITIAATAATISSTDVTSNGKKNPLNRTFASARTLPPLFTTWSKFGAARVEIPTPSRMARMTSATRPAASTSASGRCPRIRSTSDSCRSTPSSMITNRNSTMIAPAYTLICTTHRNGEA